MRLKVSLLLEALVAKTAGELGRFVALVPNVHTHCTLVLVLPVAGLAIVGACVLEELFGGN